MDIPRAGGGREEGIHWTSTQGWSAHSLEQREGARKGVQNMLYCPCLLSSHQKGLGVESRP